MLKFGCLFAGHLTHSQTSHKCCMRLFEVLTVSLKQAKWHLTLFQRWLRPWNNQNGTSYVLKFSGVLQTSNAAPDICMVTAEGRSCYNNWQSQHSVLGKLFGCSICVMGAISSGPSPDCKPSAPTIALVILYQLWAVADDQRVHTCYSFTKSLYQACAYYLV